MTQPEVFGGVPHLRGLLGGGPAGRLEPTGRRRHDRGAATERYEAAIAVATGAASSAKLLLHNLHLVDTGFFPSIGAVHPAFTGMATPSGRGAPQRTTGVIELRAIRQSSTAHLVGRRTWARHRLTSRRSLTPAIPVLPTGAG